MHEEHLTWNSTVDKWVGEEHVLITQGDSWAMDLGNRAGAQLLDWSPVDNAVPYGKAYALIEGPLDLSAGNFNPGTATGVITVDDTTSPHSIPFNDSSAVNGNYLVIRDNYLTYTGKTATTFTGCAVVEGSRGTIPDNEFITQGFPGGWGMVATPLLFADGLWDAGLRPQERLSSLMNSAPGEALLTVAPYWYQYDNGDGTQPMGMGTDVPPTGGMGVSASLVSLAGSGGAVGAAERSFAMTVNDWSDWPLAAFSKSFAYPRLVGKMAAGAQYSGSILDAKYVVRWVS